MPKLGIVADDLTGCTTKASILQKIREYEADAAAAAAIIDPEG